MKKIICVVYFAFYALAGNAQDLKGTFWSFDQVINNSEEQPLTQTLAEVDQDMDIWPKQLSFLDSNECLLYYDSDKTSIGFLDVNEHTITIIYADRVVKYVWKLEEKKIYLSYNLLVGNPSDNKIEKAIYQLQ